MVNLESSQHYKDGGPHTNPPDHPAERPSEEEMVRGDCEWCKEGVCLNEDVFEGPTFVNGGFCTMCDEWLAEEV